ncbi:hypothetical protein F3J37_01625 [Pantoea sp. Al-1710]|uniref:Uncharacterized protein n=1 Tax=Candidatus Pantoea communis TaxID=2608354 RepID=A0ABX0RIA6_9GAMM|nr:MULTISPECIES: M91 family zinc metallopeptidase [Pantoea]NIG12921.1 hypothetical protein [Pantoea sp. Cy-640]NIG17378.1 hypothetical protein [Pantoea communis]
MYPSFCVPSSVIPHTKIHFNNNQEFQATETALEKIKSRSNGRQLIEEINRYTDKTRDIDIIVVRDEPTSSKGTLNHEIRRIYSITNDPERTKYKVLVDMLNSPHGGRKRGEGISCQIKFNPSESRYVDKDGIGWRVNTDSTFAFTSLAHELVHAYHHIHGSHIKPDPEDPFTDIEEDRAIGIHPYHGYYLSENGIRRDHGLPERSTRFDRNEVQPIINQYFPMT